MTFTKAIHSFPEDFVFGVATSSYQIEGSGFGDCGSSHWDDFAKEPGRTPKGENGAIACDHYHRFADDLALMKKAGFDAYRFSFSWPRLLPEHNGRANPKGLDFYDKLIDTMLSHNLKPFATLYHWDLPSRHAKLGGWQNRDTAQYFADYTNLIMRHFGDRLDAIAPINEPWCVAWLSHYWGEHAPGLRDIQATAKAMHYIQLAHGLSINVMREAGHNNLGCVLNKEYAVAIDDSDEAVQKAALFDGIYNRWFEESIFQGQYPADVLAVLGAYMPENYQDDLPTIGAPLDWVGTNYYTQAVIKPDPTEPHIGFRCVRGDRPKTDMGWDIVPEGLSFFLRRLARDYAPELPLYVTENGMANQDILDKSTGKVDDQARIKYFADHLSELVTLKQEGLPIKGYFAWSFMDNFEWAFGYSKRFGLVYVDYETQTRIPKSSYFAWQEALTTQN